MTTTHPSRAWLALTLAAAVLFPLTPPSLVRAAPPTSSETSDLDPTASQRAKMVAGRARFEKAMRALQTDPKLSDTQKRTKAMALAAAADKEMLAILTPAQKDLVLKQRAIDDKFRQEVTALRADPKMTDKQKQARFETLMRNRQTALLATLPPALRARAERAHQTQEAQMAKERQAAMARAAEARQIGQQLQKSLSKQTQGQIQQITLAARSQIQAVGADATLSQEAKAAKIQALGHEAEAKIDALLTPQQRVQFAHYHELVRPAAPQ